MFCSSALCKANRCAGGSAFQVMHPCVQQTGAETNLISCFHVFAVSMGKLGTEGLELNPGDWR